MTALRVGWEFHPNPEYATAHVDHPMFQRYGFVSSTEKRLDPGDQSLWDKLQAVPGVREVSVSKYRVRIERGGVFEWSEITPAVEDLIRIYAGRDSIAEARLNAGWKNERRVSAEEDEAA